MFCLMCISQDTSDHDGDWNYYMRQAHAQKEMIDQLKSLLETYGYLLPAVRVWLIVDTF